MQSLVTALSSRPAPRTCPGVLSANPDCGRLSGKKLRTTATFSRCRRPQRNHDRKSHHDGPSARAAHRLTHKIMILYCKLSDDNTGGAVSSTCSAARKQKKTCEASEFWTKQYTGKSMSLIGKTDNVPILCDLLRQTEDIAFNANTIRAELPWPAPTRQRGLETFRSRIKSSSRAQEKLIQ